MVGACFEDPTKVAEYNNAVPPGRIDISLLHSYMVIS